MHRPARRVVGNAGRTFCTASGDFLVKTLIASHVVKAGCVTRTTTWRSALEATAVA